MSAFLTHAHTTGHLSTGIASQMCPQVTLVPPFLPPASTGHLVSSIPSPGIHGSSWSLHSFPWHPRVTSASPFLHSASTGHLVPPFLLPASMDHLGSSVPSPSTHGSPQSLHSFSQRPRVTLAPLFLPPASMGHLGFSIPSPGVHGSPWSLHSFPQHPRVTLVPPFLPPASTGHLGPSVPSPESTGHPSPSVPSPGAHGSPRCGPLPLQANLGARSTPTSGTGQEHVHQVGSGSFYRWSVAQHLASLGGHHQSHTLLRQMEMVTLSSSSIYVLIRALQVPFKVIYTY